MSMQVLPTAPSPTVTHFMNLEALILHRPLLLLGPALYPPAPTTPLVGLDGEKQGQEERWKVFVAGEEEGKAGEKGRGDREAGTNGGRRGKRGERGAEEAVSAPERWLLPQPMNQAKPRNGGWMEWRRGGGGVGGDRERGAHGVRAHHFLLYYSCIPINPNLIHLLFITKKCHHVHGRHGPESYLLPQ
jgi:hypothetical protein